ncbi:hypothetical protein RR46_00834 [Papilio xuthus]|uniref:Uncharacterized protein n=1 Tax=Papilio xuthus TaxID=66420 RepID=A0A0N0PAG6_PAPXU|nr:hypothetical protein RR46_00834 [Papilio xuthus]
MRLLFRLPPNDICLAYLLSTEERMHKKKIFSLPMHPPIRKDHFHFPFFPSKKKGGKGKRTKLGLRDAHSSDCTRNSFHLRRVFCVVVVALVVFNPVEAGRPPPQKREPLDVKKKLEELSEKIAKILKEAKEKAEKTAKAIAAKASEEVKEAIKDAKDALAAARKINAKVEEAFENLAKKIEKAISDIAKGNM